LRRVFGGDRIVRAAQLPHAHQIRKFFHGHNSRSEEKLQERLSLLKEAKALTDVAAVIEPAVLRVQMLAQHLTQIPKLGNRPRPYSRRARPSINWLLRREKSRSSWQLFCSVCVTVRILEDDEHENEDDFSTSEFRPRSS
jgi:hypothetical protein